MRSLVIALLIFVVAAVLSGCQAFLEDYSYQPPVGPTSSGTYY